MYLDVKILETMQTAEQRAEEIAGTQLWLLLLKSFHAVSAYAQGTLQDTGLGDSDFRVLEALLHKGPLPVNDIGEKVFLTPGAISTAVERLHAQGLVTRQDSKRDRRVRLVELTPKGRSLIERVFSRHEKALNRLGVVLSAKQRRSLAKGLKLLGREAEALQRDEPTA